MHKQKNILKGIITVIFVIFLIYRFFINSLFQKGNEIFEKNGLLKLIIALSILLIIYLIIFLYKKVKIKNLDIKYVREIPNHYSIPVVSFLYKKGIDSKSIVMATTLKLYDLNLVNIKKDKNKFWCESRDLKNIEKISKSEKYILDWLLALKKDEYSYKKLTEILTEELNDNGLIKEKGYKFAIIVGLLISIIPILQMLGVITFDYYRYMISFIMILFFALLLRIKFKPEIDKEYSKKGVQEHYNVLGLYNFLKDFSKLSERQMEEYSLWKEYLQFAILFGINKNYKLKDELNIMTKDELLLCLEELGRDKSYTRF